MKFVLRLIPAFMALVVLLYCGLADAAPKYKERFRDWATHAPFPEKSKANTYTKALRDDLSPAERQAYYRQVFEKSLMPRLLADIFTENILDGPADWPTVTVFLREIAGFGGRVGPNVTDLLRYEYKQEVQPLSSPYFQGGRYWKNFVTDGYGYYVSQGMISVLSLENDRPSYLMLRDLQARLGARVFQDFKLWGVSRQAKATADLMKAEHPEVAEASDFLVTDSRFCGFLFRTLVRSNAF